MIKLLRNIRRKILAEGKISRYLVYAIGEVALVMIGILMALGVNNWNNEKQIQKTNGISLQKMLQDLSITKQRLEKLIYEGYNYEHISWPSMQDAVKSCDSLLELTYRGLDETHFDYVINADFFAGNSLVNIADNTYSEMLNTGRIYTLNSDSLIDAITKYYKMSEREALYNMTNSNKVRSGLDKLLNGYEKMKLDYLFLKDKFLLSDYDFYFDKNSKDYKDFQIGLSLIHEGQKLNMNKMIMIIHETEYLESIIKKELNIYD